jgi:hypothetical protein
MFHVLGEHLIGLIYSNESWIWLGFGVRAHCDFGGKNSCSLVDVMRRKKLLAGLGWAAEAG